MEIRLASDEKGFKRLKHENLSKED